MERMSMKQIKICPDCFTEYFPHIETCADCGAVLLLHEENKRLQEGRKRLKDEILENPVVMRDGDLNWLKELYDVLIDSGIPCVISADTACTNECRGNTCRLVVSAKDAEQASKRINDYYMEIHPEIRSSTEMADQGKCPACGNPVRPDEAECRDCGLTLYIIEE